MAVWSATVCASRTASGDGASEAPRAAGSRTRSPATTGKGRILDAVTVVSLSSILRGGLSTFLCHGPMPCRHLQVVPLFHLEVSHESTAVLGALGILNISVGSGNVTLQDSLVTLNVALCLSGHVVEPSSDPLVIARRPRFEDQRGQIIVLCSRSGSQE